MNILGIETSCDETAAAIVQNGRTVLSNIVASSLKEHKKYGGIIPEIASRRQLESITAVVDEALDQAKCKLKDIGAIAVTQQPGLIGSLLVGISYARGLSFAIGKPLIEVDHIQAHLYANMLTEPDSNGRPPKLPAVGLVVSGGHSSLFYMPSVHQYQLLGQTRDDAVGEAFDKVARILNLGYPGGPVIDALAKKGARSDIRFKCADLPNTMDFSFSGIKTAVLYYKQRNENKTLPLENVAYAFQDSVVDVLVHKALLACRKKKVTTLLVGGGVAANSELRARLNHTGEREGVSVYFPPMKYCLDNAAMIAGLGFHLRKGAHQRA